MTEAYSEVSHQLIDDLECFYPGLLKYKWVDDGVILIEDDGIPAQLDGKFVKFQVVRRLSSTLDKVDVTVLWKEVETVTYVSQVDAG